MQLQQASFTLHIFLFKWKKNISYLPLGQYRHFLLSYSHTKPPKVFTISGTKANFFGKTAVFKILA